jgi:molybdopterin-guanine dinucleotide biosynthesis protein A
MMKTVEIAIIAGGRSTRMGADKSLLSLNGKVVIQHVIERVSSLNLPILLIANDPQKYADYNLPTFPDLITGVGPLGGLYTALTHSTAEYTLCVACDMPFLNPDLLAYLISLAAGYDAVVPLVAGYPESLHAVYSKSCLGAIRSKLDAGQRKLSSFYADLNVRDVPESEMRPFDPDLHSFLNINTPDEWQIAQQLAGE